MGLQEELNALKALEPVVASMREGLSTLPVDQRRPVLLRLLLEVEQAQGGETRRSNGNGNGARAKAPAPTPTARTGAPAAKPKAKAATPSKGKAAAPAARGPVKAPAPKLALAGASAPSGAAAPSGAGETLPGIIQAVLGRHPGQWMSTREITEEILRDHPSAKPKSIGSAIYDLGKAKGLRERRTGRLVRYQSKAAAAAPAAAEGAPAEKVA